MQQAPAGWYPDTQGVLRYWDGRQWTTHTQAAGTNVNIQVSSPYGAAPPSPMVTAAPGPTQVAHHPSGRPYGNLRTDRSLLAYILLSLVTFGIYGLWLTASSGEDLNTIAGRYDGRRTMNYWLLFFIVGPITLTIADFVWWHKSSNRIGSELARRGIHPSVSAADFWLWGVLGSLIIVGPFIFIYKWLESMNTLSANYNQFG